jgi:hypothetical protein
MDSYAERQRLLLIAHALEINEQSASRYGLQPTAYSLGFFP